LFNERLRRRRGRGSKSGVARISTPAIAIAVCGLVRLAYPHPALTALRDYLGPQRSASPGTWAPSW
jgi:hypothetical protein